MTAVKKNDVGGLLACSDGDNKRSQKEIYFAVLSDRLIYIHEGNRKVVFCKPLRHRERRVN